MCEGTLSWKTGKNPAILNGEEAGNMQRNRPYTIRTVSSPSRSALQTLTIVASRVSLFHLYESQSSKNHTRRVRSPTQWVIHVSHEALFSNETKQTL
jgi:hypothetical protein